MSNINLYQQWGITLDLALEAHELLRGATGQEIPGVKEDKENYPYATVTTITILSPEGAKIMQKPIGRYITIEAAELRIPDPESQRQLSDLLNQKLQPLLPKDDQSNLLLIGLGNWNATPDALGPRVISQCVITRHLYKYAPEALTPGMRSVCALTPGVLGITGIETAEIIRGVVEKIQPTAMIVIDALAAKSVDRIGSTIQIADTGISPGSGVGNQRIGINQETMGIPVIAIGIPTVVHAAIIIEEAILKLFQSMKMYEGLHPPIINEIINEVLAPFSGNLTVTPKEIDSMINNLAQLLAQGINQALHPNVNPSQFNMYLQ
ncbi:MAG: GPR endopeptidase [Syntrophomonadaceae bacterium]|nr:GPR endopeptidase [Syntrophomonadaceae bacterium]